MLTPGVKPKALEFKCLRCMYQGMCKSMFDLSHACWLFECWILIAQSTLYIMGNSVLEAQGEVNNLLKVCNCVIGKVQRVRDEAREHNCQISERYLK